MKKMHLIITFLTLLLISCGGEGGGLLESKKEYKYIEIKEEKDLIGNGTEMKEEDPVIIKAASDSSAYLEAYEKFCISLKVNKDMVESLGETYSTPKEFKLLDESGKDIFLSVNFEDREKLEQEIYDRTFALENSLESIKDESSNEVDPDKMAELEPYFDEKTDEFDPDGKTWHEPKSAPKYVNQDGIYCYFQSVDSKASNLRLKIQYESDDWLFFDKIQFSIDGSAYEYVPSDTETDSGNGGRIWEWSDESVRDSDKELLNALADAKEAKMKFIGSKYYDVVQISAKQIKDISRTIEYYKAMGGNY